MSVKQSRLLGDLHQPMPEWFHLHGDLHMQHLGTPNTCHLSVQFKKYVPSSLVPLPTKDTRNVSRAPDSVHVSIPRQQIKPQHCTSTATLLIPRSMHPASSANKPRQYGKRCGLGSQCVSMVMYRRQVAFPVLNTTLRCRTRRRFASFLAPGRVLSCLLLGLQSADLLHHRVQRLWGNWYDGGGHDVALVPKFLQQAVALFQDSQLLSRTEVEQAT